MTNPIIATVLLLILLQCSPSSAGADVEDSVGYKGMTTSAQIAQTPQLNAEAEVLTLEATGALIAPLEVYVRVDRELKLIRSLYPVVSNIVARPSWVPNNLMVGFDSTGISEMQQKTYVAWNDVNKLYGVSKVEINQISGGRFALLTFKGRFNMPLLAREYAKFEHVKYAEPNGYGGGGNDVCLQISGATHFYVFNAGSGDCPSGCINHAYWGFSVDNLGGITVLGTWRPSASNASLPKWFQGLSSCRSWLQH